MSTTATLTLFTRYQTSWICQHVISCKTKHFYSLQYIKMIILRSSIMRWEFLPTALYKGSMFPSRVLILTYSNIHIQ